MKFEREKVVDVLCDNLEQWVGCEGYFADYLTDLKKNVEDEDGLYTMVGTIDCSCPFETMRGMNYQFFYPVTPPEKERKLVPFDTCQELIEWFCKKEQCNINETQRPFIWVKQKKGLKLTLLLTGFAEDNGAVWAEDQCIGTQSLLDNYTLLDGTPIGKEARG